MAASKNFLKKRERSYVQQAMGKVVRSRGIFMGFCIQGDIDVAALRISKMNNPIEHFEGSTPSKRLRKVRFFNSSGVSYSCLLTTQEVTKEGIYSN